MIVQQKKNISDLEFETILAAKLGEILKEEVRATIKEIKYDYSRDNIAILFEINPAPKKRD